MALEHLFLSQVHCTTGERRTEETLYTADGFIYLSRNIQR